MARFSVVLAAAGFLLLLSMAASAKTTITTVSRTTGESCSQQMMEQEMLNHCMMYLMTSTGGSSHQGRGEMFKPKRSEEQQHLDQCCMQLRNIDEDCRCESIKMMMNQQGMSQQDMGQMMSMAMNLPQKCNLQPQWCQMRAIWF